MFDYYDQRWAAEGLYYTTTFVAEEQSHIIGFVEVYLTDIEEHLCGVVYYVGVHPSWRRKGIGRSLVRYAEKYFMQFGASFSLASTVADNFVSRNFFSKLGYVEYTVDDLRRMIGRWKTSVLLRKLWIWGDDDIIMIKPLYQSTSVSRVKLLKMLFRGEPLS